MAAVAVPPELLEVPQQTLQGYVRQCARRVLDEYVTRLQHLPISTKINDAVALQRAAGDTLDDLFGKQTALATRRSSIHTGDAPYKLVFMHDCKNVACAKASCTLCANSQHRRCRPECHFQNKYIKNDLLKARCDASVRVQLIDRKSGEPVYSDARLKVTVIDSSDYAKKIHSGMDQEDALEHAIRVFTNGKADPQPLLVCTTAEYDEQKSVILELKNGVALLPDLRICESSEALRGRGAEFRLLIECEGVHLGGQEWAPVKYALSEQFQVLSSRSKPNCKPEIPHIDDPVKNVEAIGDATVPKLERLMALARDMHIDLNIPFESITKVGEFRELARLAAPDKNLQDKLRKVLALTKDQWKMAHEHSQKAVTSDHRMRVWYPDASDTKRGVVFECVQGNVLLNKPLGMITPEGLKLETQMHSDPAQRVRMKQEIEDLLPLAVADWYKDGHGTWGVVASGDTSGGTTASMMGAPVAGGYGMMPEQQQGMVQQGSPFFAMQQPQQARGAPVRKMMRQQEPPMFGGGATPAGDVPFDSVQFGTTNNVHALMNINNALHGGFADAWPGGAGIGGMTPSSAAGGPGGVTPPLAPSVFEQPGEQFQVMLAEILAQQAGAVGGEEVNDMKRKPSRGLSELFTSMSLQQMAATESNLHSLPTTNMMDLLRNMMSEKQGGFETGSLNETLSNLIDNDPAARALFSQLAGQESGLSGSSGEASGSK